MKKNSWNSHGPTIRIPLHGYSIFYWKCTRGPIVTRVHNFPNHAPRKSKSFFQQDCTQKCNIGFCFSVVSRGRTNSTRSYLECRVTTRNTRCRVGMWRNVVVGFYFAGDRGWHDNVIPTGAYEIERWALVDNGTRRMLAHFRSGRIQNSRWALEISRNCCLLFDHPPLFSWKLFV